MAGDGFQNIDSFSTSFFVIGCIGSQNQSCQREARRHAALVKCRAVPWFQFVSFGKSLDGVKSNVFADQQHGIGIALRGCTA